MDETPDIQNTMKDIMSNFAAAVTVVTSRDDERDHGLTVSAFTSVSLEPPLVLVCIGSRLAQPLGPCSSRKDSR